jgi:hypothetical protein
LLLYSWSRSYPISIDSPSDFVFNHVDPLYWVSLALFLGTAAIAVVVLENNRFIVVVCIAILLSMYSLYYFYPTLPGSDTNTFRGLTEYAATTDNLNPLSPWHSYYQWPSLFIFSEVVTSITGLQVIPFEFVFFTILGVLYVTALYSYFYSFSKKLAWAAVIAYFIMIYWYFNYQFAPFSLAMGLLFTLFVIETRPVKTAGFALLTLLLCIGTTLVHPFAALFFVSYALVMYILGKDRYHRNLFATSLVIWLTVTLFSSGVFFNQILQAIIRVVSQEYASSLVQDVLSTQLMKLPDLYFITQAFSRGLVIVTFLIAGTGFVFLLRKRRIRYVDLALLLSASFYSVVGAVLSVLGSRAWFIVFIPLSLGVISFLEHRFGKYLKMVFIFLLLSFAFVPLNSSFNTTQIFFQTRNENVCTDFAIGHYNWAGSGSVLAHFRVITYLEAKTAGTVAFGSEFQFETTGVVFHVFPQNIPDHNCIISTLGLEKSAYYYNYSLSDLWQNQKYNRAYDSGPSYILVDSTPLPSVNYS